MNSDEFIEARFIEVQKRRAHQWMKEEERVKTFILEIMMSMVSHYEVPAWSSFSKTAGWAAIRNLLSSEDQFLFRRIWGDCEKELNDS